MKKQGAMMPVGSDCFAEIYQDYFAKVYHTCYQYSKNQEDALDWTQDVMIKIAESVSGFAGRSSLSTWIFSITRNYCISQLNHRKKYQFSDIKLAAGLASDMSHQDDLDDRKEQEEQELVLREYLAHLPEKDKRFLELKYFGNSSVKDLQKEYNLSASAVKMRLLRARQKVGQGFPPRTAA